MNLKTLYQRFRSWQQEPFKKKKTELKPHQCAGCGASYVGNFCPVCGQKHTVGRMDWRAIHQDIIEIVGLKKPQSVLSFLLQLFGRPGYLISDYIRGRRKVCASPIGMLGILAVVTMLVDSRTSNPKTDWAQALAEGGGWIGTLLSWLSSHLDWAILIQTVLLIFPTWLLFRFAPRNTRHTLPEGIYIQVFMGSLILICIILRNLISNWMLTLLPLFYFIAYYQLFGYGIWGTLWRTLLCLGVILALFGMVMSVRLHASGAFWAGLSTWQLILIIVALLALGAGILYLGYWISKRSACSNG